MNTNVSKLLYSKLVSKELDGVIGILLEHRDLLVERITGITIVHLACECNFPELIPELVKFGCDVNVIDRDGYPPIYYPCSEGYYAVVKVLLDCGADVNGLRTICENGYIDQTTPLVRGVRNGHLDVVKLLVSRGASTKVRDPKDLLERAKRYPEIEAFLKEVS